MNQSIKIYIAPFKDPYPGAPDPGEAEKNSLQKLVKLRTGTIWEVPLIRETPCQVVGPTFEKERFCIAAKRANGNTKSPWTEDRSVRRPAAEEERTAKLAQIEEHQAVAETWRRVWEGTDIFSRTKISE